MPFTVKVLSDDLFWGGSSKDVPDVEEDNCHHGRLFVQRVEGDG